MARPHPPRSALGALVLLLSTGLLPAEGVAQIMDTPDPLPPGTVRLGVMGIFRSSTGRLGDTGDFANDFARSDALDLLGGGETLTEGLTTLLGTASPSLVSGSTVGALRATQTRIPISVEVGVLDRLQMSVTVPAVRSRIEGEVGFRRSPEANLGRSPVFNESAAIQGFVEELEAVTAGFSAGGRDWSAWAAGWRTAYSASPLFPTADSELAASLLTELEALNEALVADGRSPVSTAPIFAPTPLTAPELGQILQGPPFGLVPFEPVLFFWELGDIELDARYDLLRRSDGAALDLTLTGGVTLPTSDQENPDLPRALEADRGALALRAGGEIWLQRGRWMLGGGIEGTVHSETEVVRRIAPPDVVFAPFVNRTLLGWTPGSILTTDLLAEWAPTGPLRLSFGYRLEARTEDDYVRRSAEPGAAEGLFPRGSLFTDPGLLAEGSLGSRHWIHGGFRWLPALGEGFEIRFDLASTISGSGDRLLDETEIRLGARRAFRLW